MTEVFITDIPYKTQAYKVSSRMLEENTDLKVNFDFNKTEVAFPCEHTILRMEGDVVNSDEIIAIVKESGFKCEVLEDKICKQSKDNYDRILGIKFSGQTRNVGMETSGFSN